jgi:hypothetical protein
MPTPNMKGKEMIYWIKVETQEKRLVTDLEHFLKGASQQIDLRVPSAFVAAKVELETSSSVYDQSENKSEGRGESRPLEQLEKENRVGKAVVDKTYVIEIVLRRTLPDQPTKQSQSPYG